MNRLRCRSFLSLRYIGLGGWCLLGCCRCGGELGAVAWGVRGLFGGAVSCYCYEKVPDCCMAVLLIPLCASMGQFGIQIPKGAWHSIELHEPSAIFEAKDGAYVAGK